MKNNNEIPKRLYVYWHCNTCKRRGVIGVDSNLSYYEVLKSIQSHHTRESTCSAVAEIGR